MEEDWGYADDNGPYAWHRHYPIAREGKRQSPINIIIDLEGRNVNSVCCNLNKGHSINNKESVGFGRDMPTSSKVLSHESLRQRITQDMSLHEQNQNTSNVPKRTHHHHHHHHHGHGHHQQHSHHRHHHHSRRNENDDMLDSTGNSPVRGSSSSSSSSNLHDSSDGVHPKTKAYADNESNNDNAPMCIYHQSHKKIFLGYPRSLNNLRVTNTGHGWQVNIPREIGHHTLLTGPPLDDRNYRLAQFHCHWGEDCDHGSEHLINGKSFAAELHFVHWNSSDFDSIEEAAKHEHGLAVLGVLVQAIEGEQNRNKYLDKIIQSLDVICEPGQSSPIQDHFDIKKLFPANRWTYASYEGSLTTPPLSEVVDWIVFLNPIQCSTTQIELFRRLVCGSKKHNLVNNCRPIQPVHDRIINIWTHH